MFESKFDKLYKLILEDLNKISIGSLFDDIKIQQKSNNNFPEGHSINITNELKNYYFHDEINSVILTKHCIKSVTETDEIHGVNYVNITKNDFLKAVSICLFKALENKKLIPYLFNNNCRFACYFKILKTNCEFILAIESYYTQQSLVDFKLITLFYDTFKTDKDIWKQTDTGKKFLSITFPEQIFVENKINQLIQLNQIDLIVLV